MDKENTGNNHDTMHADGFVSYARADLAFVKSISSQLETLGRRLWLDLEGIYAGEQWWPRICAAVENADAFLFHADWLHVFSGKKI